MRNRIIAFVKEPTSLHVIINTFGNYLNVFFIAFFALIMFRNMTPSDYGMFSVLLGISYVLAQILEFGTTATIYSSVPVLYGADEKGLYRFLKSTFFYQTFFSVIIITALLLSFPFLDAKFFKTGAPNWILTMTGLTVIMFIWQNFLTNILFAAKRFFRANIYLNAANIGKAFVMIILAYTGNLTVATVIMTYGFIGPLIFFILFLIKNYERIPSVRKAEIHRDEVKFGYTVTYFAASQFYNVGLRMDLFLMSFFGLGAAVGYYASAQKIILSIVATIVSISQVLSPQFAAITTRFEAIKLIKKGLLYMLIPCGIFVALFLTPKFIFELVLTDSFAPGIAVTRMLAFPFMISALATVTMLFLLYTVKKPIYILISNIAFFIIVSFGSYYLIPIQGMFGPPIAITAGFIVALGIQIIGLVKEIKLLKN